MKRPEPAAAALPKQVQIEPAGECNLRCEMCAIRLRSGLPPGRRAFMQPSVFKAIIDQFPGDTDLHLQGLGEPLLHPDFFNMVSYAVSRGMRVTTNSNMTLMDSERAEACVRSGLSWIRISIDGATAETYESIRKGGRLGLVLKNIGLIRQAKERLRSPAPRLFFVMVVMRRNIHELAKMIRLAAICGIEQVFAQHLCYDFIDSAASEAADRLRLFVEAESLLQEEQGRVEAHFHEALSLSRELNIELRLPALVRSRRSPRDESGTRCDWPWRSAYITYDGTALPCCVIAFPDQVNFGNMAREGVRQVWNNEAYQQFRSLLVSPEPHSLCRSCALYQGIF
jgi:radical SAM protein with 4Fe4S-binding SPASM domain